MEKEEWFYLFVYRGNNISEKDFWHIFKQNLVFFVDAELKTDKVLSDIRPNPSYGFIDYFFKNFSK
jgi:hypothetical protein